MRCAAGPASLLGGERSREQPARRSRGSRSRCHARCRGPCRRTAETTHGPRFAPRGCGPRGGCYRLRRNAARVAELADAPSSGGGSFTGVQVRLLSRARRDGPASMSGGRVRGAGGTLPARRGRGGTGRRARFRFSFSRESAGSIPVARKIFGGFFRDTERDVSRQRLAARAAAASQEVEGVGQVGDPPCGCAAAMPGHRPCRVSSGCCGACGRGGTRYCLPKLRPDSSVGRAQH